MSVLLLSFDLSQKDALTRIEIESQVDKLENVHQIAETVWLIETELLPGQILNQLVDFYDANDNIFVFTLDSDWEASAGIDHLKWLEDNIDGY